MGGSRYFQSRIRLLGTVAAVLVFISFGGGLLLKAKYDSLVAAIRERGLGELQRYQNLQRKLAETHLRVTTLMTGGPNASDEQHLYSESKAVANLLDSLIVPSSADGDADFRDAVVRYRADVILAIEMLTVNPALSDRYLVRSAASMSRMNIDLARNFESRRSDIELEIEATLDRTNREILALVGGIFLAFCVVLLAIAGIARRLSGNFQMVETGLARLGAGESDIDLQIDDRASYGEFKTIAAGLQRFKDILTERDLAQSQMQAIFNSMLEGVIVIDERGQIVQTNLMAAKLFGYTREELSGKNVRMLMPPEISAAHDGYLAAFRKTGVGRILGETRSAQGRRRDGSLFPIQLAVSLVAVRDTRYFVGIIADVTDRLERERLLREARDAAVSSSRLKADFLATMSHEIRTPMNGILGMAQLLDDERIGEEERRHCTRILLSSSRTLITLLNDILDLSKVEAGKIVFNEEPTLPAALAEETASLFVEAAHAKGLALEVSADPSMQDRYLLDPVRVRQMLSNLVSNAVKFTDRGEVRIELRVEPHDGGDGELLFRVVDSGPGIHAADRSLLFDKYSQLDSSPTRRHGGTGLGLSIVRQFATAMRGEVGVESEPGKGSIFWFRIPARRSAEAPASDGARQMTDSVEPPTATKPSATFRGRILIAEDIAANRLFLQLALRRLGLDAVLADNGREAVKAMATQGPFDCVFMDMRMPEMDGDESTRLIRQWETKESRSRCPIVAVTANAYDEDRKLCLEAGMDDFLAKPFSIADLQRILKRWLPARDQSRTAS